jgi:hypothetical protein
MAEGHSAACDDGSPLEFGAAITDFDHESLKYEGFIAENEKTFLSAVDVGLSKRNSTSPFEQLPYELFVAISEHLDIASLVTLASVSVRARGLVQGLPGVS